MKISTFACYFTLLASSCLTTGAQAAGADGAPPPVSEGDIVVTALRREARLQDVPIAISATSGDLLQRGGQYSFTTLGIDTPSLRIVDGGPGSRRVILRGITGAGEPTVGVYYDETPVSGSIGTVSDSASSTPDFRLFDVDRVEVLRGPQGTLYGSGSMGGTLRVLYQKPKADRYEAAVDGNISHPKGGDTGGSLDAMINLPLIRDVLALRLVGSYNKFAGYVDNNRLGYDNVNDGHSWTGRAALRFTPNDRLTVDASVSIELVKGAANSWLLGNGDYTRNARSYSGTKDTNRIYSATARYDFDGVALIATTAWFDRDRLFIDDYSDTFIGRDTAAGCATYRNRGAACAPGALASYLADTRKLFSSSIYQPQTVNTWTNEVRLSSTGQSPFNFTVGGYSQTRGTTVRSALLLADPATGRLLDPNNSANIAYDRTITDHLVQKAAFVELSYRFFEKLTLTAGTRYFDYSRRVGGRIDVGQEQYSSTPTPYREVSTRENGFVYKFNAAYKASNDILLYAQAAQGFRPGGANQVLGLPANLEGYGSDSLWTYEGGIKTTPLRGLRFNVSGYHTYWKNIQISARTTAGSAFAFITNAGDAVIDGFEAELGATIAKRLTLNLNASYTDARLATDQATQGISATGKKGDRLPSVPQWLYGGTAEYSVPLGDGFDGLLRADAFRTGSSYSTLSSTDANRRFIPASTLVNLRVGAQADDRRWGVYVFVNNVFDVVAINTLTSSSNYGGQTLVNSSPPRTVGLNLTTRF